MKSIFSIPPEIPIAFFGLQEINIAHDQNSTQWVVAAVANGIILHSEKLSANKHFPNIQTYFQMEESYNIDSNKILLELPEKTAPLKNTLIKQILELIKCNNFSNIITDFTQIFKNHLL